ncbi:MAG TPA: hypothetical protein PKG54_12685 [Phycisphaerae bacterium]|nr:hypothetical protein [Phycisphaerae bacterium]HOB75368.1 hypothetical protein [Phycisphaerae bacterium]HOJ55960.1 hypothetical protein [Phycisphaerae bacterium]HPP20537.1 hypothetical protein [Phycisphaerae bacterium]HQA45441.1 hypothetical protein [Phycisphaerae bacterium]
MSARTSLDPDLTKAGDTVEGVKPSADRGGTPEQPSPTSWPAQLPPGVAVWTERLSKYRFSGQPLKLISDQLGEHIVDTGRFVWGGTGNATVYYLLPGSVVVAVDVDVGDRVYSEPLVGTTPDWRKNSRGEFDYFLTIQTIEMGTEEDKAD